MPQGFQRREYFEPSRVNSGAAEVYGTLTDRLRQFSGRMRERGDQLASIEGETAGAQAGAEGTPKLRSNLTAYGRAFNDAAVRNYTISKFGEMEKELARIEIESGSDPDQFVARADGLRSGALQNSLPAARGLLATLYQRRIAEGAQRLIGKQAGEKKALNAAMLQQGLDQVADSISRKMSSGDPLLMAQAEQEEAVYAQMIDGGVVTGDITPAEAVAMKVDGVKKVTSQIVYGEFERQVDSGDPVSFINRVMEQPVENLSDEEKQQLVGNLFLRLNQRQALVAEADQQETLEQKTRWKEGERDATLAMLQRSLTLKQLSTMVANDELDPAIARTLENDLTTAKQGVDDPALELQVRTNLLAYEEDDIARMGGLSHDTRYELILKRRAEAETWRNDQGAQEALRRIDVALGIPAGLGPQFQISVTPEKAKSAASARSYFYDLVESLPPDQRKAKYFELADKAVRETGKDVKRIDLAKEQQRLKDLIQQVGRPEDLDDEERGNYDEAVKRRSDRIKKLEQEIAQ